jgi:hypothetical protein
MGGFQMKRTLAALLLVAVHGHFAVAETRTECVRDRVSKYAPLCESADVVARAIAIACKHSTDGQGPPRGGPQAGGKSAEPLMPDPDKARYWADRIAESKKQWITEMALVGVMNARAANPPSCWTMR